MSTHEYKIDNRNENIFIYVNGDIVPRQEAKVSVFDSGFLLGDGVWEGIRYHNGHLVFKEDHFSRLYASAKAIALDVGKTETELERIILSTLEANKMVSGIHIRLIVSRGLKKTPYQNPNVNVGGSTIVVIPEYKIASEDVKKIGISLGTVSIQRGTANTQDPKLNTLSKLNCILACVEANELGYDEGLMLDVNGFVSTCNSTNFFIVQNGEVWTSTGEYCLNGVTRGNIIRLCKENDIPVYEKNFLLEDCYISDEAFVSGTFAGVIPVMKIDGHELHGAKRGELTERLQKLYKEDIEKLYPPHDE